MKEKHRGRKEDFGMGTVIIIWVAIIIAIRMAGKSMDKKMADDIRKAKGEESVSRPARASTAGGRNTAGRGMSSSAGRSYAGENFSGAGKNSGSRSVWGRSGAQTSWHNTAETSSSEISFRNMRPGTDELEALIRHNARHERELEARLRRNE